MRGALYFPLQLSTLIGSAPQYSRSSVDRSRSVLSPPANTSEHMSSEKVGPTAIVTSYWVMASSQRRGDCTKCNGDIMTSGTPWNIDTRIVPISPMS